MDVYEAIKHLKSAIKSKEDEINNLEGVVGILEDLRNNEEIKDGQN